MSVDLEIVPRIGVFNPLVNRVSLMETVIAYRPSKVCGIDADGTMLWAVVPGIPIPCLVNHLIRRSIRRNNPLRLLEPRIQRERALVAHER